MSPQKTGSKKSESLEVRVSFETKEALRNRAHAEGRSISRVVRRLINSYLSEIESSAHPPTLKQRASMFKQKVFSNRKFAMSGMLALAVAAATAMLGPLASADEINLSFKGEFVKNLDDGGNRTKRVEYSIVTDHGKAFVVDFDIGDQKFSILVMATEAKLQNGQDGVMLSYQLREKTNNADVLIATPVLIGAYGEDAIVQIDKGEGISYNWTVRPEL